MRERLIGVGIATVIWAGVVGLYLIFHTSAPVSTHDTQPLPFIAPDPLPNVTNLSLGERVALEKSLRDFGASQAQSGSVTRYGIYYRGLYNGETISIGSSLPFYPASLLKLPVALWYYKQEETHPGYLDSEIQFSGPKGTSIVHYPPPKSVQAGQTYTLRQLITFMLQDSDNDATTILSQYAGGRDVINSVYTDLGVTDVSDFQKYQIDEHTYATFLSVLFNARYLNRADSNDLLSIMAGSDFTQGIRSGVPQDVPVAEKFGEYSDESSSTVHELHDCGIVYVPGAPYLLCVMTQGPDFDTLANFIVTASKDVYGTVTAP